MGLTGEVITTGRDLVPANGQHGIAHSDALALEAGRSAEQAVAQMEAQARALVQARFAIAQQPHMQRNWDRVEQMLRRECARPGFAAASWWILPLGGDPKKYPQGLSIRFAEAALRMARNIDIQQQVIFDDDWKRTVRVSAIDLEGNFGYTVDILIEKTVERNDQKDRKVLAMRAGSGGRTVYTVIATEQELALKQNSAVSKAIRTCGLRLIPGDILDECKAIIKDTRIKGAKAEDPETARKAVLDSFAGVGVMPDEIARFLGHDTNIFQPAELEQLRGIYVAIRDGHITWKEVIEEKEKSAAAESATSAATQALRDKLKPKSEPAKTEAPKPTEPAKEAPVPQSPDGPMTADELAELNARDAREAAGERQGGLLTDDEAPITRRKK